MTARRYVCHKCGVGGVKLWRDYGTPFHWDLWCVDCACAADPEKGIDPKTVRDDGTRVRETHFFDRRLRTAYVTVKGAVDATFVAGEVEVREDVTDQLGWYVPAVPSDGPKDQPDAYWGYTSTDSADYQWWIEQPLRAEATVIA